jgi:hypothetical protein
MKATGVIAITEEARVYGLEQLCRRAGLPDAHWGRWRIETTPNGLALRRAGDPGRIVFPAAKSELRSDLVVRKSWLIPHPDRVSDFIVPFCTADSIAGEPLFVQTGPGEFLCTEDLAASAVLVLSRFEEIGSALKDEYGRFPVNASISVRDGYFDRPIVDEWGLALEQVIAGLDPGIFDERTLRVMVTHDIDVIGIPFGFRQPAVQLIKHRKFGVAVRDLLSGFTGVLPGSLRQVIEICEETQARGLKSAVYWKASAKTEFDTGYDIRDPRVARVMDWLRSRGVEMGVHPGYNTFGDFQELSAEVERLRGAIGERYVGGRQHYLRWSPETWLDWEKCGLAYDTTVGFAGRAGFRAGTCWPYHPWLWNENRRAQLLEIPLIVMESSLISPLYMGLSPEAAAALVRDLMQKCARVGGVFTLLWHNNRFGRPYDAYLAPIFDELAGSQNYDWREDVQGGRVIDPTRPADHRPPDHWIA